MPIVIIKGQPVLLADRNHEPLPIGIVDDLRDADTTTDAPNNNDVFKWDGTNWVPGSLKHESHIMMMPLTTGLVF